MRDGELTVWEWLKQQSCKITPKEVAERQLYDAKIELLSSQQQLEYWDTRVACLRKRVTRLQKAVIDLTPKENSRG